MKYLARYIILIWSSLLCACSLFSVTSPEQRITLFPEKFPKQDAPPITIYVGSLIILLECLSQVLLHILKIA